MAAQQINQGATVTLSAPALQLGTVTVNEAAFDGPSISVTDTGASSLPHNIAGVPTGWTITIQSAISGTAAVLIVTAPLTATVSTGGAYSISYYDSAGDYYSLWFDVILADATPETPTITQIMQGQTGTVSVPLVALGYHAKYLSIESPEQGTWIDDGSQGPLPYTATFTEAPAPAGWSVVITEFTSAVAYTLNVTPPNSYQFGVYTVIASDQAGHYYEGEFEVIPAPPEPSISTCPCINGFDVVSEVQLRLRESQSTTAQQQSQIYLRHVRRVLDEVCRRTFTLFDTLPIDLIKNQIEYVMPHLPFEIRSMAINDGSGNIFPLANITAAQADSQYPFWQNTSQPGSLWTGIPSYYVQEGNRFWLLPTPNYNQPGGLIARGYSGVGQWYEMDQCLPTLEGFDEVVVLGTAIRRCIEMAPQDPMYAQMLPIYKAEYKEILRRLYRERINRTEASRQALPTGGRGYGYGTLLLGNN